MKTKKPRVVQVVPQTDFISAAMLTIRQDRDTFHAKAAQVMEGVRVQSNSQLLPADPYRNDNKTPRWNGNWREPYAYRLERDPRTGQTYVRAPRDVINGAPLSDLFGFSLGSAPVQYQPNQPIEPEPMPIDRPPAGNIRDKVRHAMEKRREIAEMLREVKRK